MMSKRFQQLSLFCAVVFAIAGAGHAQSSTQGAIAGTVEDLTDAAVAKAAVTIHNDGTNAEQHLIADDSGYFKAPLLEPGTYTVTITAPSFGSVVLDQVTVQVGQLTTVMPHLKAGGTEQSVEVSGEAPVMNFEAPDFSSVINQTALANVPINNRRWSALALTTPGVVADSSGFGLVSVRGISTILNNVEIDGADDNQAYYAEERGRTREGYSTSGAAVREFQVNTGVYAAEFGRAAGGVINSVTKSGGNQFHGQIYGYDRQSNWAAFNNYTTETVLVNGVNTVIHLKPEDLRKIYGFTVGGPVIIPGLFNGKDKLFWTYTYDQHSRIFPAIATPSTPVNFYLQPDAAAPAADTCNTTTGQMTATTGTVSAPDQEVCLMAARLNAAGYGNFGGGNTGYAAASALFATDLNNLNSQDLGSITRAGYQEINTAKLDYQLDPKEHVSFLYHRLRWDSPGGVQTQNPVFYGIDTTGTDFVKLDYGVTKLTSLITSNISNEILYQYGRELNDEGQTPFSTYTTNNLVGPTGDIPEVVFSSTGGGLTFGSPYYSYRLALPDEHKWQMEDTLYYSRGNHTFKFGADLLHNADLLNNTFESNGVYTYGYQSNYFTDLYLNQHAYTGPGVCNAAASQVYAAGAVGTAPCYSGYVQGYGNPVFAINTFDWALFAQDNWKVSSRLTLELGVRYDKEMLPTQQASYINPNEMVNGVAVGANHPSDNNNFGPRIGFAYDTFGTGKTIVRGGFGMYYGRLTNGIVMNALLETAATPAQYTTSYNSTASAAVPAGPKFPNIAPAPASGPISPSVEYLDKNLQNPMVEEFDLIVQQQVGKGTVFSLNYIGALGKELTNFLDFNLNPNKEIVTVSVVDSTGKGPLGPTGTQIQVPVFTSYNTKGTSFGAITDVISNINSNYNAFVAEVQNHSLRSVQFDVNYTWAHALDYNQNTTTTTSTTNWLDPYANPRSNYGNGSYNVPNRFVAWGVYNLPKFLQSKNWASYLTNGWSVDDSFQAQSGLPLSITVSGNVASNKVLGGWNGGGDTQYIPNVGRNTIKYPRHIVDDARVQKQIDFTERYNLQLFVNIFNIANHQNIDGINTTGYAFTGGTTSAVTATYQPTLGTVTSSNSSGFLYTPRQLEVGAKFSF
jgi:Carboxypeptidase regulatory-like domain/TonB dependent receptor